MAFRLTPTVLGVVGSSRACQDMYGARVSCGLSPHRQNQQMNQCHWVYTPARYYLVIGGGGRDQTDDL